MFSLIDTILFSNVSTQFHPHVSMYECIRDKVFRGNYAWFYFISDLSHLYQITIYCIN